VLLQMIPQRCDHCTVRNRAVQFFVMPRNTASAAPILQCLGASAELTARLDGCVVNAATAIQRYCSRAAAGPVAPAQPLP
jgi:hypothetical protein